MKTNMTKAGAPSLPDEGTLALGWTIAPHLLGRPTLRSQELDTKKFAGHERRQILQAT